MVETLRRLGAKIEYADNTSGYALVILPREKLLASLDVAGIAYAYTSDDGYAYSQIPAAKIPQSERKPESVPQITIPYPRVGNVLPPDGPYFAEDEIGLSKFWQQHPAGDGRGVRVAVEDDGFDLLHPALQEARDATGQIVPKVADMGTLTTPEQDAGWVQFGEPIQASDGVFEAAGRIWTAPEDGTYRLGIFKQDLTLGPEENTHVKKVSLSAGVLWDERSGKVWVDTDGDGSFKNQHALGDYGLTHDVDWFGKIRGEEDDRLPFGVKIVASRDAVYIRIGGWHGALVAGPLAGNSRTGGLFNGAAPSAQLIDENFDRVTMIAAMVKMAARSDVDVVNRSGGIGRSGFGYTGEREGIEDFALHVLERVIAVYGKPIAAYSAATGTIHVQDYAGPEMLRRNRQVMPPYRDTINSFVWDLPNGLVNTVLAPSANLGTQSRYMPWSTIWEDGRQHTIGDILNPSAPDAYMIGSNPSPTIPVVSGLLADLISEAKHEHVRYNATRLNNAIFTGTRLLDGFPLSQQGYGLINADKSWDQLTKMAKADDPANPELTSFTVSRIEDGHSAEVQGFHSDLLKPGEKLDGEIWITRRGGYAGGRKYTFALRGNDGSFDLVNHEGTLERDKPVKIRFCTNGASGWNIVFLELRDVKADVVMEDVPLSVRVPDVPQKIAPGVERYQSIIQPLRSEYRYVRVGDDVQAARYTMRIPYTGPLNISTRFFPGFVFGEKKAPSSEAVDTANHVGPMESLESLVANDRPGTQEIFWENRGRPEYATQYDGPAPDVPIHATLTVTKYSIAIAKTQPRTLMVTNKLADVEGHVELFDAKVATSELKGNGNHTMAEVEREVPADLAEWRLRVTVSPNVSARGAHIDAYLFNCTGKAGCITNSQQQITDNGASLVVEKPQAGAWKIVIRSRESITGNMAFQITDAQLTPTPTSAAATDAKYTNGEKWIVPLPGTSRYAAFRIAGTPDVESEKYGLLIAITPLGTNLP